MVDHQAADHHVERRVRRLQLLGDAAFEGAAGPVGGESAGVLDDLVGRVDAQGGPARCDGGGHALSETAGAARSSTRSPGAGTAERCEPGEDLVAAAAEGDGAEQFVAAAVADGRPVGVVLGISAQKASERRLRS
ncbi:hypothetical protein GCM10009576_092680 [Streptomyces rhizosphaericus]|uniref:Uncharacterized protein n=1 Tax=Streptomyces rhizosphaericus TaxID=114699 RepID=A0ABN1SQ25_9ACTN|nr:hypothetical protein [Streptomyces indonesiensis]